MAGNILFYVFFLFFSLPGAKALSMTDYSTLEALCIAILVLFLIWIIVIVILIFCCKSYIEKMSNAPSQEDEKPGRSDTNSNQGNSNQGNSNQGYRNDEPRSTNVTYVSTYNNPKVHPTPQYERPQVREQGVQTDTSYMEPLGPSASMQTDYNEDQNRAPHRLVPLSSLDN